MDVILNIRSGCCGGWSAVVVGVVAVGKQSRSFSLDQDVKSQLQHREDLNASAIVNEFLREYLAAGRAPDAALSMRLEKVEHELENARSERARLESRIERLERERSDIQSQMDGRREEEREAVEELAKRVRKGLFPRDSINAENPAIQNSAAKAGVTPQRLVDQLRAELGDE